MTKQNYIKEIANKIRIESGCEFSTKFAIEELFDAYALLALAKGVDVCDEDIHDAWSTWATKYDPDDRSIVPFNELTAEMQAKDSRFTRAVVAVVGELE